MQASSTRIYGIIAREAPIAVLFRRGPSTVVQLIKWNLENDTFEKGQWLKGRIYERRSDLSPSGKYLIYFAAKHNRALACWTAISKPPHLTALALWEGMGSWGGGGLFDDEHHIQLNHMPTHMKLSDTFEVPNNVTIVPCGDDSGSGEDSPIMDKRMERDGWTIQQTGEENYDIDVYEIQDKLQAYQEEYGFMEGSQLWAEKYQEEREVKAKEKASVQPKYDCFMTLDPPDVHVKAHEDRILEMTTFGFHEKNGPTWPQEFRVLNKDGNELINLGKTDWADWDRNGDLLFSRDGLVMRAKKDDLTNPKQLIDLSKEKFAPISPTDEFRNW